MNTEGSSRICVRVDPQTKDKADNLLPHGSRQAIYEIFTNKLLAYLQTSSKPARTAAMIAKGTIRIDFNDSTGAEQSLDSF